MARFSPPASEGKYLPTTDIYDITFLEKVDINSQEFRDYLVRLQQTLDMFALYINAKASGNFGLKEQVNGKLWFNTAKGQDSQVERQGYQKVLNVDGLPAGGTKMVPHGVEFTDVQPILTSLWGGATNPTTDQMIPLPYSSPTLSENISIYADDTNIYITVNQDWSDFTEVIIVFEFLKT